jgi:hypothetical protein
VLQAPQELAAFKVRKVM